MRYGDFSSENVGQNIWDKLSNSNKIGISIKQLVAFFYCYKEVVILSMAVKCYSGVFLKVPYFLRLQTSNGLEMVDAIYTYNSWSC